MFPIENELYERLNVSPSDDKRTIRKAYLQKCKNNHPDKNQNIETDYMRNLNEAKDILLNDDLRKFYDSKGLKMTLKEKNKQDRLNIPEIDEKVRRVRIVKNVFITLKLTLLDLYTGKEHILRYDANRICLICEEKQENFEGNPSACDKCKGTKIYTKSIEKKVVFYNVDDNECVLFANCGHQIDFNSFTDLIIIISLEKHEIFQKFGENIYIYQNITYYEAINGKEITVKYLDDIYYKFVVKNTVIQHNSIFVASGMGIKNKNEPARGNFLIIFKIKPT